MKKIHQILFLLFCTLIFNSCKKEIPNNKINYIGTWRSSSQDEIIIIDADGGGSYENSHGYTLAGRVKFKSPGFEIKAIILRRKFSIDMEPTPYTSGGSNYYAKFNGSMFYRN